MALVRCILGKFLGVVCHCFPPFINTMTKFRLLSMACNLVRIWLYTDISSETAAYIATLTFQSQAKVLTGSGDLSQAQVDVPLSVRHSRV
jgi:hypothetical protein